MFDWFVDTAMQLRGIDAKKVRREKEEKKRLREADKFIFSQKSKIVIAVMGVLYLIMTVSLVAATKGEGLSMAYMIKSLFLGLIDIAALVAMLIGKKKGEIIAAVLVVIFVATMYISVFLG